MGWTFEVEAYVLLNTGRFEYVQVYAGESLIRAWLTMRKAKQTSGAVRLTWRS